MVTTLLVLHALCAAKAPSHIYFVQSGSIARVDLDGSNYAVLHAGLGIYSDVAVDEQRGYVYFTTNDGVYRMGLEGRQATRIISICLPGSCVFRGLAVEPTSGDILYGVRSEALGNVRRAASDGSDAANITELMVDNFVLSPDGTTLFADAKYEDRWTVVRLDLASLEVTDLLGGRRTYWMEQVAYDPIGHKVYCQSAPQSQLTGPVLTRVNPDGSELELIGDDQLRFNGLVIAGAAQTVYLGRSITTAGQLLAGSLADLPPREVLFYPDVWISQLALDGFPDPVAPDAGGYVDDDVEVGCGCQQASGAARAGWLFLSALLLLTVLARRQRRTP